jgi:prepilin-type N-terminal cleavage/methylation domain-containing protein
MYLNRRKKTARGFTVIELLVVIAIVVTAVIATVNRVQAARQSSQVNSESGNLSAIVAKVQSSFAGRPNYTGVSTAVLLAQNAFPSQMLATTTVGGVTTTTVNHSWNGTVAVAAGSAVNTFDITYNSVPSAACIELVSSVSRSYNEITVGTTKTMSGATIADLTTLQTACTATSTVKVVFNAS